MMKMKALFAAFVTILLFALMSCKTSPKDAIVRKWKITNVASPELTAQKKQEILNQKGVIEFMKDGKYSSTADGQSQTGTYTLSEDGKSINMTALNNPNAESMIVEKLDKDSMILNQKELKITFANAK